MDRIYAVGLSLIEVVQYYFSDAEPYFTLVNQFSNPRFLLEMILPLVANVDALFASQMLLSISFGTWLNYVLKCWTMEDRPYWWVKETKFYGDGPRPQLIQHPLTCETGPGSPSGHASSAATMFVLMAMWIAHVLHDRKINLWWWRYAVYPLFFFGIVSVMMARMFIGAHFPHQCVLGAGVGACIPAIITLLYVDPYVWRYAKFYSIPINTTISQNIAMAVTTMLIGVGTYGALVVFDLDPYWTIKKAVRWCENPDDIVTSTTPMFALVESTAYLLGWALSVTPDVAKYRHNTKDRSVLLSIILTALVLVTCNLCEYTIPPKNDTRLYATYFVLNFLKAFLMLRVIPSYARLTFTSTEVKND